MTFADQLRQARHRLQYTQEEMAAALECSMQTVSNYECGRTMPWPKEQVRVLSLLLELELTPPKSTRRVRVCERI